MQVRKSGKDNGAALLGLIANSLLPASNALRHTKFDCICLGRRCSVVYGRLAILRRTRSFGMHTLPRRRVGVELGQFLFPTAD